MSDFEDYVKVKTITVDKAETHLLRISNGDHTFAHIEITPSIKGCWNLRILQVSDDDQRTMVKWVPGLQEEQE